MNVILNNINSQWSYNIFYYRIHTIKLALQIYSKYFVNNKKLFLGEGQL